jgi:hypothetical protein
MLVSQFLELVKVRPYTQKKRLANVIKLKISSGRVRVGIHTVLLDSPMSRHKSSQEEDKKIEGKVRM